MITKLGQEQVFVFGSNEAGIHGAGAARQAYEQFGACMGVGEGPTGQCYAFPTLDKNFKKRSIKDLQHSVRRFFAYARITPEKTFLLTPVGTGLAGYGIEEMKKLFKNAPKNVVKPKEFIERL